jgi:hypothetical protein
MKPLLRMLLSIVAAMVLGRVGTLTRRLQHNTTRSYTRRTFVRNTVLGGVGIVLLEAVAGFVYFFWPLKFWPLKTGAFGTEIVVSTTTSRM